MKKDHISCDCEHSNHIKEEILHFDKMLGSEWH
jgi:hypothetical protein